MKKNTLILGLILMMTLFTLTFIHFSNDHIECEAVSNTETNSRGVIVKTESHICNEKYNF